MSVWIPSTFKDKLLAEHFNIHPGTIFIELKVWLSNKLAKARKIDAILIPKKETNIYEPRNYLHADAVKTIRHQRIHLIEAKRKLTRGVIGQVLVGRYLVERAMKPSKIIMDIVCSEGNPDLKQFCNENEINVYLYPISSSFVIEQ